MKAKWHKSGLHSVTGNAKHCGPCALSAVTGESSDKWPDANINLDQIEAALMDAGLAVCRYKLPSGWLRDLSPDVGVRIISVGNPILAQIKGEAHVVAVGMKRDTSGVMRACIVDNNYRDPVGFHNVATG